MISERLREMESTLRSAAAHQAYSDVERGVIELCAAAAKEMRAGDPREIATWVEALLDWTETMVRTSRAAHADDLRRVPFLKTYLQGC